MKKTLAVILSIMCLGAAACGDTGSNTTKNGKPKQLDCDYGGWAEDTGYGSGMLISQGADSITDDRYHTLPEAEEYSSGKIVVGDSRCCQMGIFQQINSMTDFAVFSVWSGHYAEDVGFPIINDEILDEIGDCFARQLESKGECTIYLFATVNDYNYTDNDNSSNIESLLWAANQLRDLTCIVGGKDEVHPTVKIIGFAGGTDEFDIFGSIPHDEFNRYIDDYNANLMEALENEDFKDNTTVGDILGDKLGFLDDGLHYDGASIDALCEYIAED